MWESGHEQQVDVVVQLSPKLRKDGGDYNVGLQQRLKGV